MGVKLGVIVTAKVAFLCSAETNNKLWIQANTWDLSGTISSSVFERPQLTLVKITDQVRGVSPSPFIIL